LTRMRNKVYAHVQRVIPQGARQLELNAGTGTDAVALAQLGYNIHATDISNGMLDRLRSKVTTMKLENRITVEERSFLLLDDVQGAPFDAVFSNLGGLNCIPDLTPVIQQLPKILKPGGVVTWVLMPHICLWELGEVVRLNFRLAFRRLSRRGVPAHLEGLFFNVYYFSARQVVHWFGEDFQLVALEGLSVMTPTAESKDLAVQAPRLYRGLCRMDDLVSTRWPFCGWGDFYILTMRYQPRK